MKKENFNQAKWDERFMRIAAEIGSWSSCIRDNRQVGAVIVKDRRILATGYNGAPSGLKSCLDRHECMRDKLGIESGTRAELCYSVHAEQNAILQAAKSGTNIEGATIYITHQPCSMCTRIILNSGIKRIVYDKPYPDQFALDLLSQSGIEVCRFNEN